MDEPVDLSVSSGVARIVLNRPEKLNAFNTPMLSRLWELLRVAERDPAVKVIVVSGAGRCFSAGADLTWLSNEPPTDIDHFFMERGPDPFVSTRARSAQLWDQLWEIPKPIITQVHGYCLASGCELAFFSDYTIASTDARFGEPESKNGWCPASLWLLSPKHARSMFLLGDVITASEALEIGLVNKVVAPADLQAATDAAVERLLAVPAASLAMVKRTGLRFYATIGVLGAFQASGETSAYVRAVQGYRDDDNRFQETVRTEGLQAALRRRDRPAGS